MLSFPLISSPGQDLFFGYINNVCFLRAEEKSSKDTNLFLLHYAKHRKTLKTLEFIGKPWKTMEIAGVEPDNHKNI